MHNLNDMILFARMADMGGISAAAKALEMPKSKVSRRMALLEEELGLRLFERSPRGIYLTEAGQVFYLHCQRVVEEAQNARASLNLLLDAPRGLIRISTSITLGQQILVPYLAEFMHRYPDINIELVLENRRVDLIAEGYDLAIRVGKLDDSSLISKRLNGDNMKLFASPFYFEHSQQQYQLGAPQTFSELKDHKMLMMLSNLSSNSFALTHPQEGTKVLDLKSRVKVNDLTSLRQLAVDGLGIALLPGYMAKKSVEKGELLPVLEEWGTESQNYYLLYPSHRSMTPKLRVLIDYLADINLWELET